MAFSLKAPRAQRSKPEDAANTPSRRFYKQPTHADVVREMVDFDVRLDVGLRACNQVSYSRKAEYSARLAYTHAWAGLGHARTKGMRVLTAEQLEERAKDHEMQTGLQWMPEEDGRGYFS